MDQLKFQRQTRGAQRRRFFICTRLSFPSSYSSRPSASPPFFFTEQLFSGLHLRHLAYSLVHTYSVANNRVLTCNDRLSMPTLFMHVYYSPGASAPRPTTVHDSPAPTPTQHKSRALRAARRIPFIFAVMQDSF